MKTIPTDFQRPDFDTAYEDDEKNSVTSEGDPCCTCTPGSTSVCATENDSAHYVGSTMGYIGAFWFK